MSTVTPKGPPLPFRARSYMAFVLAPRQPIANWLADLDASIECSKGIYSHHPVALDMSAVSLNPDEIAHLIAESWRARYSCPRHRRNHTRRCRRDAAANSPHRPCRTAVPAA